MYLSALSMDDLLKRVAKLPDREDVVSLLRNDAIIRHVSVEADLDPGLPSVLVDRVQLQQVFVNLLMNAFDALGTATERRTTVTTRKDGTAIHVSVKDSGSGIPVGDLTRVQPLPET